MRNDGTSGVRAVELTDIECRERKSSERAARRGLLKPGDEFRPYDLFDEVGIVPTELLRCSILTSSEKLCWIVVARRLGRQGKAFPSYDTIATDLGVDRRQAIRLVSGLAQKRFLRLIVKHTAAGDRDSNEYRMLWHEVFMSSTGSDNLSPRVVTKCHHPVVTDCHPNSHHHQKGNIEKRKEQGSDGDQRKLVQPALSKTGGSKTLSNSSPDDDEKPVRGSLSDAEEELRLRFKERFGDSSGALFQIVIDGLAHDRDALKEFVAFDNAHTGRPKRIVNPGGYYRRLVASFLLAQKGRIEAERKERYREIERSLVAQPEPEKALCELGLCSGGGELCEGGIYRPCDCEAGKKLSPQVREMMEILNRGAA